MADTNAFPNKELEDLNLNIKQEIEAIKKNLNLDQLREEIRTDIEETKKQLVEEGLIKGDLLSSEDRSYVNTLPSDYKNKALRYLDIFRDTPEIVSEYLNILKKFGSDKAAKEAGADNVLFYPNKVLAHVSKNPEKFNEETLTRLSAFDLQGGLAYDLAYREDDLGKKIQKEHYGKLSTKIISGVTEPAIDTIRAISKVVALVADKVGPENTASAVDWIEANWPKADDITYPNKDRPFDQDSAIQNLITDLAQFGIDIYTGGRLIKIFGWGAKKVAPGMFKKITERVTKQKPKVDKAGKEIADSFGNIKFASSIAQKMGFWGLPVKYGIGRAITSDEKDITFTEGFGLMPTPTREQWNKMTKKERAVESLKRKLIHGAEGTVLIAGLTKGITLGGKVIWGGTKWAGRTLAYPTEKLVSNPISGIMKSRKTGIPQLAKGIRDAGGFISSTVLRIPPYKKWAFFPTTQGPLLERILGYAESNILPPLRVRGPWTKEAKEIFLAGEQMVRGYKKSVGLMITQIDRAIYDMLGKGLTNRAFTTSSVGAGKQHWDDVIAYLKGEIKIDALPPVLGKLVNKVEVGPAASSRYKKTHRKIK